MDRLFHASLNLTLICYATLEERKNIQKKYILLKIRINIYMFILISSLNSKKTETQLEIISFCDNIL